MPLFQLNKLKGLLTFCISIFYIGVICPEVVLAQCPPPSADITISGSSSTNYILNAGDTMHITTTGNYSGDVTIAGGVLFVCASAAQNMNIITTTSGPIGTAYNFSTVNMGSANDHFEINFYNYGTVNKTGDLIMDADAKWYNYGITTITGKITTKAGGEHHNYGSITAGSDFKLELSSLFNNYTGSYFSASKFILDGNMYNAGIVDVGTHYDAGIAAVVTIDGGCFNVSSDFTNVGILDGITCGTITVSGSSDNSGTISGYVAIVDASVSSHPWVDLNTGTVDGTITGVTCGCPGAVPQIENCSNGIDDNLDGFTDAYDLMCDLDGDGVNNEDDQDDDNDGIDDLDESDCNTTWVELVGWKANVMPYASAGSLDPTYTNSAADLIFGSGIGGIIWATHFELSGINQPDLNGAIADNDYIEFAFTTNAGINGLYLQSMLQNKHPASTGAVPANYGYDISIRISNNGFTSSNNAEALYHIDSIIPATWTPDIFQIDPTYYFFEGGKTYTVRVYFFNKIVPATAWFDDLSIFGSTCAYALDVDGDGIPNHMDFNSDGDACPDVVEAGYTDHNNDSILGDNPVTVDVFGLVTSGVDGYTSPDTSFLFSTIISCSDICGNGLDDNGNGLIDCDDPDCGVSTAGYFKGQNASYVFNQTDFTSNISGTADTLFNRPYFIMHDNASGKVFVSDAFNHRVLRYSTISDLFTGAAAEAVLGQPDFVTNTSGTSQTKMNGPHGLAISTSGELFIADYFNSRVLKFNNAATIASGSPADVVLGQSNFTSGSSGLAQNRLSRPTDLFIEADNTLWISDRNNRRVLRFDNATTLGNGALASGVLGNPDFVTSLNTTTDTTVGPTEGIEMIDGDLYVADLLGDRILIWNTAKLKANGAKADRVLGQPDFVTSTVSLTRKSVAYASDLHADADGNLYVTDLTYKRVLIFYDVKNKLDNADADDVVGQSNFTSNISGLAQNRFNTPISSLVFKANNRTYLATCDYLNHRILLFSQEISTLENVVLSDTLKGEDVANTGYLNFSILQQPDIGTVVINDSTTGTFTYTPTGPCMLGTGEDTLLTFKYKVENGNGCADTAVLQILVSDAAACVEICNDSIDNDGDGFTDCADSSDCVPPVPGVITASNDTVCNGVSGEAYSISAIAGATSYDWTVPAGATITAGQGTTSISVDWGSTSGNVCVRSYNGFCYSDFSCKAIQVNFAPGKPVTIFH